MAEQEKKPMSIEQAGNYIKHKDFKEESLGKIQTMKEEPLTVGEASNPARLRLLRIALACLSNKGKDVFYKKLLACRIKGATTKQIALAMKVTEAKVDMLEMEAIDCVKEKLSARKITPVVT